MWDIFRYFDVRDMYVNNLEYEVGYLTQEVIYHYQVVLEIYQMVDNRYIKHPTRNFGPVNYVFFMYTILLEKCKIIIHLCNMMHELEEKYKKTKSVGVFAEHEAHSRDSFSRVNMSKVDQERIAYQKSLEQKAKDDRKKQREEKKYYKEVKKFGKTTKKRRKIKKKSPWPLDYGWSIEDW